MSITTSITQISDSQDKRLQHEDAAHEKRKWVRLTSMCNNKCTFCLDTLAHNETMASEEEIKAQIIEGRRDGATRLILSGGEPTVHPHFVKFVKYGRMAGYRRVQTVTNGRMFSYPGYLKRCLDAGLQEITFSVHGHNAKVHDALVGVKGAFEEEVRGIKMALADGRPIINMDVCLNKGNIKRIPELLHHFIDIGVKEFDLLHLIPFGNAWEEKHRKSLMYDIDDAKPYIEAALKLSERPDIHIWFNRFPPPYLEGYEHLIQDPYKLNDEARGRFEEYELWLTRNMPLSCRQKERCDRCYLQHFCDTFEETQDKIATDRFDAYRVSTQKDPEPPESPAPYPLLWIHAKDLSEAREVAAANTSPQLILELESYDDAATITDLVPRILRVIVDQVDDLKALLDADGEFEVLVRLNNETAAFLKEAYPKGHPRLALSMKNFDLASDVVEQLPDLQEFFEVYSADIPVENVPECVTGRAARPRTTVLDSTQLRRDTPDYGSRNVGDTGGRGSILNMLDDITVGDPAKLRELKPTVLRVFNMPVITKGVMDLFGYAGHYISEHYYTKSIRCRDCRVFDQCEGMHINYVRARGYATMQPLAADSL
ncbi:MAG TPA: radical SAM protein [Myxococcales bacterium]|nr:radical SAM protein [Myxococcales bacterium]